MKIYNKLFITREKTLKAFDELVDYYVSLNKSDFFDTIEINKPSPKDRTDFLKGTGWLVCSIDHTNKLTGHRRITIEIMPNQGKIQLFARVIH